jgi:hypothetical protein
VEFFDNTCLRILAMQASGADAERTADVLIKHFAGEDQGATTLVAGGHSRPRSCLVVPKPRDLAERQERSI